MPSCLLIIGYVWPEPNSSAAGSRMLQLIQQFKCRGWNIIFASPAKLGEHKCDLYSLDVQECNIALNDSSFDEFLLKLNPQCVLFDRFMMEEQFGWRVAKHAPNAIRILNTEDLHSMRQARQQLVKQHLKTEPQGNDLSELGLNSAANLFKQMACSDEAQREIAAIFRSDLTLMISEFEMQLLQAHFQVPKQQLLYLALIYQTPDSSTLPNFNQREHFVTIGNFRHQPNWDAVLWLKNVIWPQIRQQLPKAELHIYGAYPPPKATALHNDKQGFLVKGWAEDANEVIRNARVLLAPLRFGAGIKGKLAEAMLNGTPSVTTPIGAEAMYEKQIDSWPGYVSWNPSEFSQQAVKLYQERLTWQEKHLAGLALGQTRFSLESNQDRIDTLFKTLEKLSYDLTTHRNSNFIGLMLNHHHQRSTQYMSQWIEAKNKLKQDL